MRKNEYGSSKEEGRDQDDAPLLIPPAVKRLK